MFGPRLSTVFASRWKAVWWSALILATAYCTVPVAEKVQQTSQDKAAAAEASHKSPWSRDAR
jgi:hypothetical protein